MVRVGGGQQASLVCKRVVLWPAATVTQVHLSAVPAGQELPRLKVEAIRGLTVCEGWVGWSLGAACNAVRPPDAPDVTEAC